MLLQVQIYPVDGNNVLIVDIGDSANKLKSAEITPIVLYSWRNITSCFYFSHKQEVNNNIIINNSLFTFREHKNKPTLQSYNVLVSAATMTGKEIRNKCCRC